VAAVSSLSPVIRRNLLVLRLGAGFAGGVKFVLSPWVAAPIGDRGWWVVAENRATEQLNEEVDATPSLDGSLQAIPPVLPPGLPSMVELRPLVPLGPFCFLRRHLRR
jgi:hypothetical protein